MIRVDLTGADPEALARRLAEEIPAGLARAVLRAGQDAEGELTAAVMETLTKRPTGSLARSFRTTFRDGPTPTAIAATDLPYAAIQDQGGVITPKRARNLAIPLDGIPRGMGPREYGAPLHYVPSAKGGYLADAKGRPRFLLRKRVTITGAGFVALALARLEERLPAIAEAELGVAVKRAESAAGGS